VEVIREFEKVAPISMEKHKIYKSWSISFRTPKMPVKNRIVPTNGDGARGRQREFDQDTVIDNGVGFHQKT